MGWKTKGKESASTTSNKSGRPKGTKETATLRDPPMTLTQINGYKTSAIARNPLGVRVAYEGLKDSLVYIAGYLGFKII